MRLFQYFIPTPLAFAPRDRVWIPASGGNRVTQEHLFNQVSYCNLGGGPREGTRGGTFLAVFRIR